MLRTSLLGLAAFAASALLPKVASACGGFFCNQAQPVNQAAEGIIFADNGDGTVTAVIQIQYQGPSKNFSWLLPISSVPKADSDIGVASNLALQRLQTATNPSYSLTTRVEGTCKQENFGFAGTTSSVGAPASGGASSANEGPGGVTVEASGIVGAFEWSVISLDKSLTDPADVAVAWLTANGFDVPSEAPKLLGPYLAQGLYLLALKLTKGADAGSIRPIVLTYAGTQASIPVKLTAVAANNDMGVLTWLLGKSRAVPQNYLSLQLNEARINWFNAASNYNSVVIDAANDAGGQGFVTELAGPTSTLKGVIWSPNDEFSWNAFSSRTYQSFGDFFQQAFNYYGQYDGFWDATAAVVTLPANVTLADLKTCPNCYATQLQFSFSGYLAALQKSVIDPMKLVQNLVDAHPEITRLYTTLSPEEMTLDPLFTMNPDLPDASNVHTAERVIECNPSIYQYQAPWRVELPQGGVVRGTANSATWPDLSALPPNRVIVRTGASGAGKVVEDNSSAINAALAAYNATVPGGGDAGGSTSTTGGGSTSTSGGSASTARGGSASTAAGGGLGMISDTSSGGDGSASLRGGGGGCAVAGSSGGGFGGALALAALGAALARRRRREGSGDDETTNR